MLLNEVSFSFPRPLVPYFDRVAKGKMWSEAQQLNDGDLSTGLLLFHRPMAERSAYVGVDFLSSSTWVKCVKLMQGPLPEEYVKSARWMRKMKRSWCEVLYIYIPCR